VNSSNKATFKIQEGVRSEGSASDYAPTIKVLANNTTERMLKKETTTESRTID